jgi:hypothetical protein
LAEEYGFEIVDASMDVRAVSERLKAGVARVLSGEPREPLFSIPKPREAVGTSGEGKVVEMSPPAKAAAAE